MHKDCAEPVTRPRHPWYHVWHLSMICFEWCCADKSQRYRVTEFIVKFLVVLAALEGAAVAILVQ